MLNYQPPALETDLVHAGGQMGEAGSEVVPLLVEYWRIFERWKWIILGILALSMLGGLVATLLATPQYTATGRLEINRDQKKVTNVEELEPESVGRDQEFYQTQYKLLEARSLAQKVARDLKLGADRDFFAAHGIELDGVGIFGSNSTDIVTADQRAKRERDAISLLLGHVVISPIRDSRLADVSYSSGSPEMSTKVANAWMRSYIDASISRRFAASADARTFLERRLEELRAKLEQSERDLVAYARDKRIVTLASTQDIEGKTRAERTLAGDNLIALNDALARATADRIDAESRTGGAAGETSAAQLALNPALAGLRQRRAELAAEYAKLMVQFEPGYPRAVAIQEQISALDASISREERRILSATSSDYRSAVKREAELRDRVEALQTELGKEQQNSIQYNIYQREVDTNRQLYDGLLQRYKEIGVAGVGTSNIAVVDPAERPTRPSSPKLTLNLLAALILGIVIAAITTYALEQSDEGVKEPSQVTKRLGVPLLGSVPKTVEDPINILSDPKSDIFEAFLTIRTNLALSTDHGIPRAVMLTSTRPAEGKSTSSIALASVFARMGRKVVLIDADMRSPSIHKLIGIENERGLSNYLTGDEEWTKLLHQTRFDQLHVITTGPIPPSAAELLSTDRLIVLVETLLRDFDHVVIDSPPMLGMADAPLISRAVEGCLFVIESEGTAIRGVASALARLKAGNARIFGAVLTKISARTAGYGYGYGSRYGYGYGANYQEANGTEA